MTQVFFGSHEITIRRLRQYGQDKQNYSATFTAYSADIQPLDIVRTNQVEGRIGATFEAFVDASMDVREGDQLVSGGYTYSVRSVSHYQGAGLLDHKYLILVKMYPEN